MASQITIQAGRIFRTDLSTRMPFRYGIATVTELPHVFVELTVQIGKGTFTGIAADHLAPKWFTKNPDALPSDEIDEMLRVVRHAVGASLGLQDKTPFALWRTLYDKQAAWGKKQNMAPLLSNFGTSLVERALIDAFCKFQSAPFAHVLTTNALGIDWESPDFFLTGKRNGKRQPKPPLDRVRVRHTVGLADPLSDADIAPGDKLSDGLPQSLEACIKTYGLTHFKLKVGGKGDADADRLGRIVQTIADTVTGDDWAFSIDGNESYQTLADFRAFWQAVQIDARLKPHLAHRLLFVEQPLHRNIALSDEAKTAFADWPDRPPIIIDESDADFSSLPRALDVGYAGTSHKNCKGIFKGVRNAALIARLNKEGPTERFPLARYLLSGEDLTNIGPISLQQDLAVQAALGIESVERNGQHYFSGLSQFPAPVQAEVLRANPDLFVGSPLGWPTLRIENGWLDLTTVNAAPLGTTARVAPEGWAEVVEI